MRNNAPADGPDRDGDAGAGWGWAGDIGDSAMATTVTSVETLGVSICVGDGSGGGDDPVLAAAPARPLTAAT
jgi:hypothetical protein